METGLYTNNLDYEFRDVTVGRDTLVNLAKNASKLGVGGVWIYPSQVLKVAQALATHRTAIVAGVGYQNGMSKPTVKAIEVTSCIKDGATRVEVWLNASHVLGCELQSIKAELLEIARAARAANPHVELFAAIEHHFPQAYSRLMDAVREGAFDGVAFQSLNEPTLIKQLKMGCAGLRLKVRASALSASELLTAGADIVGVKQL